MQIASQVYIVDGVSPPPSGWKYTGVRRKQTSSRWFHSRYTRYNPAVLVDSNGLTLLDAGTPESFSQIRSCIEGIGFQLRDIRNIFVSHCATDHIGELKHLVDISGARVYAHRAEIPWLLKQMPEEYYTRYFDVTNIDVALEDGDIFDIAGGLKVIHTPGHKPGHISFYLSKQKVLFASDLVRHYEGELHLFPPQYTMDYVMNIKSMLKVAQYDFDILVPYHGQPLIGSAGDKFREFIEYLKAISDIFLPDIKEALAPEMEG